MTEKMIACFCIFLGGGGGEFYKCLVMWIHILSMWELLYGWWESGMSSSHSRNRRHVRLSLFLVLSGEAIYIYFRDGMIWLPVIGESGSWSVFQICVCVCVCVSILFYI